MIINESVDAYAGIRNQYLFAIVGVGKEIKGANPDVPGEDERYIFSIRFWFNEHIFRIMAVVVRLVFFLSCLLEVFFIASVIIFEREMIKRAECHIPRVDFLSPTFMPEGRQKPYQ